MAKKKQERMAALTEEVKLKGELRDLMLEHALDSYYVDDLEKDVVIDRKEAEVKLKRHIEADAA